jgi:hypothetical protein
MELLPRVARPRFPGTAGEREASRLIREKLEAAGLSVREEEFSFGRAELAARRILGSAGLTLLALAWWLASFRPLAAVLIVLGLLAASLRSGQVWLVTAPYLKAAGPGRSRNIIAARPGTSPSLYLCAHYDSKSQTLPLVARLALGLFLCGVLALLAALLIIRAASSATFPLWPLFGLAALAALVLTWQAEGNESPGALDNAAAVALLLELAAVTGETGFIFFGAEELGLLGSQEFVRRHSEAKDLQVVNLDGIGLAGGLRVFGGRGELGLALRDAARGAGVALSPAVLWPGLLMDHVALVRGGVAAASLGCVGGASARIHSASDTPDLVELEGLREAAAVLLTLLGQ